MNKNQIEIDKEISLKDFLKKINSSINYIYKKLYILFLCAFFGLIFGFLYSVFEEPKYKAVLTFALEEEKSSLGGGGVGGIANSLGLDIGNAGGGVFASSNIIELMKSKLVVKKALLNQVFIDNKKKTLLEYYIQNNNIIENSSKFINLFSFNDYPNLNENNFNRQQDSIFNIIHSLLIAEDNLKIFQKDKKVSILYIEVISKSEFFSKLFCESLAIETSNFYIDSKSKKAIYNLDILQKQVDSVRSELNSSINSVAASMDNVYNLNPALNVKGSNTKKRQVDVQANTTILSNLTIQLELAKITVRKETPLIQLIDAPRFPLELIHTSKKMGALIGFILGLIISIISLLIYKSLQSNI
jgi:hypothetical protein